MAENTEHYPPHYQNPYFQSGFLLILKQIDIDHIVNTQLSWKVKSESISWNLLNGCVWSIFEWFNFVMFLDLEPLLVQRNPNFVTYLKSMMYPLLIHQLHLLWKSLGMTVNIVGLKGLQVPNKTVCLVSLFIITCSSRQRQRKRHLIRGQRPKANTNFKGGMKGWRMDSPIGGMFYMN